MKIEIELTGDPALPVNVAFGRLRTFAGLTGLKLPTRFYVEMWELDGNVMFELFAIQKAPLPIADPLLGRIRLSTSVTRKK